MLIIHVLIPPALDLKAETSYLDDSNTNQHKKIWIFITEETR